MKMNLPFSEWTPDQPGVAGGLTDAINVYPINSGYAPLPDVVNFSETAAENLLTVFASKFNGTTYLFAGGASKLFKYDTVNDEWDDVSKSGGYSATGWDVTQYGSRVIAANGSSNLQSWVLGSSTVWADLAAAAPAAKYVTVVKDFVVAANLSSNQNRVLWSDINDETDWTAGAASQADYQDIPDGGDVRGITGGEFGLVLMESAVHRMDYAGAPYFFQFSNISRGLGCFEPGSVAQYMSMTFFLSDDGFYMCDGVSVKPIGSEKIDRFFFRDVLLSEISTMSAASDPIRKLILWNYKASNGSWAQLIYHWPSGKWSYGTADVDRVAEIASTGISLDSLDPYGTVDTISRAFDSRLWAGGKFLMAGIKANQVKTFDGSNLTATITTGDLTLENYDSVISVVRPIVNGGSGSVSVCSRDVLNENIQFGNTAVANTDGRCSVRSAGRWHRVKLTPTGNWTSAVGLDIDLKPQGTR
jgi:hypothetical protein